MWSVPVSDLWTILDSRLQSKTLSFWLGKILHMTWLGLALKDKDLGLFWQNWDLLTDTCSRCTGSSNCKTFFFLNGLCSSCRNGQEFKLTTIYLSCPCLTCAQTPTDRSSAGIALMNCFRHWSWLCVSVVSNEEAGDAAQLLLSCLWAQVRCVGVQRWTS